MDMTLGRSAANDDRPQQCGKKTGQHGELWQAAIGTLLSDQQTAEVV